METDAHQKEISVAFINDKSPVLDEICKSLATSGTEILFRSEKIKDGLFQLSALKTLPKVCVIDLDFYDRNVLAQLQELRTQYPAIKLIAHSDIDEEKTVKALLDLGFSGYVLLSDEIKKAIEIISNGKKYLSAGIMHILNSHLQ